MKRSAPVFILLATFSVIIGYLFHKISWVGRVGINLFYGQYSIFKSWWKSTLLVFVLFMVLYGLHTLAQRKTKPKTATLIHIIALLLALSGLYYTYSDFRHDFSHRIAGERFHLGFYLLWIGWIFISLQFLFTKRGAPVALK